VEQWLYCENCNERVWESNVEGVFYSERRIEDGTLVHEATCGGGNKPHEIHPDIKPCADCGMLTQILASFGDGVGRCNSCHEAARLEPDEDERFDMWVMGVDDE